MTLEDKSEEAEKISKILKNLDESKFFSEMSIYLPRLVSPRDYFGDI
jgi:hypothetical protein